MTFQLAFIWRDADKRKRGPIARFLATAFKKFLYWGKQLSFDFGFLKQINVQICT